MIIYGVRSPEILSEQSTTAECPNCNTKGSTKFIVFSRHAHVFWIPIFPAGKFGGSHCMHCDHFLEDKEMPTEIKREFDLIKQTTRIPIWQFAGLILIVCAILANLINTELDKNRAEKYLTAPLAGDIYEYTLDDDSYSTFKVMEVKDDSVLVCPNEYVVYRKSDIEELFQSDYYSDTLMYILSISQLQEMFSGNEIFGVKRE